MLILLAILVGLCLLGIWVLWQDNHKQKQLIQDLLDNHADNLSEQVTYQFDMMAKTQELAQVQQFSRLQTEVYQQLSDTRDALTNQLIQERSQADKRLESFQNQLNQSLQELQNSNTKHLDSIRQTVDEKLEKTLHNRLKTSFDTVSQQLESVNKGLGEMQTVARDVGALHKVLSASKTRGILGELQLGQIIEDMLAPHQYEREFSTVSGSTARVEYAIKLPGQGNQPIYLPIDAKFPMEDYYRLEEAYEMGDKQGIQQYRKELLTRVKQFARDIQKKYLNPPETTQFGILFLPTESLYAEIVRQPEFFDGLRRQEHVLVAGPSTLAALLNALSVGFKTLNIQKNADDISQLLGHVRTEFDKFGGLLAKTQKQLKTASNSLDSLMTTRTRAIVRALESAESYQEDGKILHVELPMMGDEDED